jgi:hypothetical protein
MTTTEALTIRVSSAEARKLRRVSEISGRPIDDVVSETLRVTLPLLPEDLPIAVSADLRDLELQSNDELLRTLFAQLDEGRVSRYDALLDKNAKGDLNTAERHELEALRAEADALMFRKAYAALVLKWRGQYVPALAELDSPSQ